MRKTFSYNHFLISLLFFLLPFSASCQTIFTIGSGLQLPGNQDQKFKKFDVNGQLENTYLTHDVDCSASTFNTIQISKYFPSTHKNKTGFRIEYFSWKFTSNAEQVNYPAVTISNRVQQDRIGMLATILRQVVLKAQQSARLGTIYLFVGTGLGTVATDVDPGRYAWSFGFQTLVGVNQDIGRHISISLESRYLLSRDADNHHNSSGWAVDTSGTPTIFRFGDHFDTRFGVFQLGLSYKLYYKRKSNENS